MSWINSEADGQTLTELVSGKNWFDAEGRCLLILDVDGEFVTTWRLSSLNGTRSDFQDTPLAIADIKKNYRCVPDEDLPPVVFRDELTDEEKKRLGPEVVEFLETCDKGDPDKGAVFVTYEQSRLTPEQVFAQNQRLGR